MSFREIDDVLWKSIEPYLPPQKPLTGRPRANMRKLMNGILDSIAKIIFVYFEAIIISFKCYFNPNLITQITLL